MSVVKPTPDAITSDDIAVAGAVAVLAAIARRDFATVTAQLEAAGFVGITGYEPIQGTPNIATSIAADIGAAIEGRGIYHGAWQPQSSVIVHAYADTDFLRDASGKQLLLTWYKTRDELARRNDGRRYGDGTEAALRNALTKPSSADGAYQDGDLVMGPQVLLNGRDVNGKQVRAGRNTFDLLSGSKNTAFKQISETLRDAGSDLGRWSWSCTEVRYYPYTVSTVRLPDGYDGWGGKGYGRLGVLPFRFFREPHAVKAVSHLAL
jgi:hypothetical protein